MTGTSTYDLAQALQLLRTRRSFKPRHLALPAPTDAEITHFAAAAITAPDHGNLRPWRFLLIASSSFARLADAFEQAAVEIDGSVTGEAIASARAKAMDAPCVVALSL